MKFYYLYDKGSSISYDFFNSLKPLFAVVSLMLSGINKRLNELELSLLATNKKLG